MRSSVVLPRPFAPVTTSAVAAGDREPEAREQPRGAAPRREVVRFEHGGSGGRREAPVANYSGAPGRRARDGDAMMPAMVTDRSACRRSPLLRRRARDRAPLRTPRAARRPRCRRVVRAVDDPVRQADEPARPPREHQRRHDRQHRVRRRVPAGHAPDRHARPGAVPRHRHARSTAACAVRGASLGAFDDCVDRDRVTVDSDTTRDVVQSIGPITSNGGGTVRASGRR